MICLRKISLIFSLRGTQGRRIHWFLPTPSHVKIGSLTWEALLEHNRSRDPHTGEAPVLFYAECLRFNRPPDRRVLHRAARMHPQETTGRLFTPERFYTR